jgi:hypothetical protein
MSNGGKETLFSMGDDTALAVLSESPRTLYDYFKQRFAQVSGGHEGTFALLEYAEEQWER